MFESFQQVESFFESRKQLGIKPGLDRINNLLHLLGNPEKEVSAIHVAGTNGKGSTIQFIHNGLVSNGYRVGSFTSPSLEGLTGHISINYNRLTEASLLELTNIIHPYIKQLDDADLHLTEFEILTAIAFLYFADNVDVALIETGMGGREDTTNCFTPILSIITNVEKDHTTYLGKTIESIAAHKAGIIKENRPVIAGEMREEAIEVITAEALMKNVPLYKSGKSFRREATSVATEYQSFRWLSDTGHDLCVFIQAVGPHQLENASLAMMTFEILTYEGMQLDWNKCIEGLSTTDIPGRLEAIHRNPAVILDGAHNPAGIKALTETLEYFSDVEKHLVFAAFGDKDLGRMLPCLEQHFTSVTLTTFDHSRAARVEELEAYSRHKNVYLAPDWQQMISSYLSEKETNYFITGSLHFLAEVRKYFEGIGKI